jgi:hypothetical protein
MSQSKPATYLTSDLALATTISLNFPIEDIDRSNPRKAVFVFRRSPELDALVDSFFTNQLKVAPQTFFNQLRDVKARLYAEKRPW